MIPAFRPSLQLLSGQLVDRILDEAFDVLTRPGIFVENPDAVALLLHAGADQDSASRRVLFSRSMVERAVSLAPKDITLYDSIRETPFSVGGAHVHFDPGSAALTILDPSTLVEREPVTADLIRFSRLVQRLEHFHFQSTGIISSDVAAEAADAYRLFICLQYCSKPIATGIFATAALGPMIEMLGVVRGGAEELRKRPLAIFDACPSAPLQWSMLTAHSVMECARAGIPSEIISVPLAGATGPVTLTGSLVQHAAENLAGIVIAQLAAPGAPVIFGGSPAIFDMRSGSTPLGAIETMMLNMGASQIGKRLGLPTHAYMGLSDAKCVDAQAGLESGIGTILAALSGINVVSGAGMMDFESCQSLEKLVVDNDICGMAYRLLEGAPQRNEPMARDLLFDILRENDLLSHPHTVEWHRREQSAPAVLNRDMYQQWVAAGKPTLAERARGCVEKILDADAEPLLEPALVAELRTIMEFHARRFGMQRLPFAPLPDGRLRDTL